MNTIKKAELLASFMGDLRYRPTDNFIEYAPGQACNLKGAEYHTSWDWLMPVVEKIECTTTDGKDNSDNFFNVIIEVFECNINGDGITVCEQGQTKLEGTYKAVVEFIQWYNENK